MTDELEMLAGEYALRLLEPEAEAAVAARLPTDVALAMAVDRWREQLTPLADANDQAPARDLWPAIAARLAANDNVESGTGKALSRWRSAAIGLGSLAAALVAVVALRPAAEAPIVPQVVPAAPMVASLSGEGGVAVTVAYVPGSDQLLVTPVVLDARGGDTQLWVIPQGSTTPLSIGLIADVRATRRAVAIERAPLLRNGATIAISREARGGSTTGAPQGPVIATGTLTEA